MDQLRSMTKNMTEEDLLDACRDGNRDAFEVIFSRHQKRVFSVANGFFGGNQQIAEDITQQVFLKLYTNIKKFRGDAKVETWLYRITVNACIDEQKKRKRLSYFPEFLGFHEGLDLDLRTKPLFEKEISDDVHEAIGELKPKFRVPILLKYSEGLSYREMAEVLDCSEGTIASRLNRGHKMLARKLKHLEFRGR